MENAINTNFENQSPTVQLRLFDVFDPTNISQRSELIIDHPLMLTAGGYQFPTPSVDYAFTQLVDAITSGLTGIAWVAFPRYGKTSAVEIFKKMLKSTYPEMVVISFIAKSHKSPNEILFYSELLNAAALASPPGRNKDDYLKRLTRSLCTCAASSRSRRVILLIDEAQKLKQDDYAWLIDVSNELRNLHVSLTVALFAQPVLVSQREIFRQTGMEEIIGRFMVTVENFEGTKNANELEKIMYFYDDPVVTEYPVGSRCSCTEFFLPYAYRNGWRLHKHAQIFWNAFQSVANGIGENTEKMNIGMNWIKIATQNILISQMESDKADLKTEKNFWIDAVKKSGYAESLAVLGMSKGLNHVLQ